MKRRIFSVILALALVAALGASPVFAAPGGDVEADTSWYDTNSEAGEFSLSDAGDLLGLAQLVNSGIDFKGKTVYLANDIDIQGIEWTPIGITFWDGDTGHDRPFRGTFDGLGQMIHNLTMTNTDPNKPYYNSMDTGDYYAYGFFGGIDGATIRAVAFDYVNINCPGGGENSATNTQNNTVGAAVGAALGSSTIENVTVSGSVTGVSRTAGIVGYIGGSKAAPDSLFTDHENSMGTVTVKNCVNNAEIKSMRTESSHGTAAGICATVNQKAATSGTVSFEGNKNTGKVEGYLAAGICASTFSNNTANCEMAVTFTGNSNSGSIEASGVSESSGAAPKASGIAIINDGGKEPLAKTTYTLAGNSNSGAVTANAASDYTQPGNYPTEANRGRSMAAGILVNGAADGRHTVTFSAESANVNSGSITGGDMAAGIVTEAKSGSVVQNVSNSGAVTIGDISRNNDEASGYYVGGIAAYAVNGAALKGSLTNTGSVSLPDNIASDTDPGRYCAGGIVGMLGDEYNGDKDAPKLDGASCVSSGEVSGSGTPYAGKFIGQLRTGEVSNVSGENAIGAVKMVGSREHTVKLTNVSTGELDVVATHNQSFTYTMDLNGSTVGTIDVDGATHTGMTLEISGGTVETVDLSGVTGGYAKIQFAATNGAKVGTVNAEFDTSTGIYGVCVGTQAWNNKGTATEDGNAGSIGEVRSNVGVTVGFVHNHQENTSGNLSDHRVFTNAEGAIGSIATTKTVTTAATSSLVPKDVPAADRYAAPDSNTAASAAYYLASSLDETATKILGGDSGAPVGFTGVELTASGEVEDLTIASGKTLIIAEDVTLTATGTVANSGTIHNYGTINGTVNGDVINYYDVTLDYGNGTVKVVTESGEFTLPTPEREGYSFLGWYDTAGNRYVGSYTPTADVTLTARWSEIVIPDPNPITVTQSANGTISTNFSNASVGTTITVTATPNSGYELAYITVNGEKINGNTFKMPDKAVTVSAVFVPATGGFVDVVPGAWYVDAVNYVVSNGLMEGTSATTFEPEAQMTRAMFWTILARIDGETITGSTWADDARAWAMANGVSDGTNPHAPLTREQLVTMLHRYLGEPSTTGTLTNYTDANAVSAWAKTAMAWAVNEGVITGITPTTLAPQSTATRAQCATILMRNAF